MEFVILKLLCLPPLLAKSAAASCFPNFLPHSISIRMEAYMHLDKHPQGVHEGFLIHADASPDRVCVTGSRGVGPGRGRSAICRRHGARTPARTRPFRFRGLSLPASDVGRRCASCLQMTASGGLLIAGVGCCGRFSVEWATTIGLPIFQASRKVCTAMMMMDIRQPAASSQQAMNWASMARRLAQIVDKAKWAQVCRG